MTTQAQTNAEQIFAGIFSEANLAKFNDNTVETDIFLDDLEKQFPDFIFIMGPNLFNSGNSELIINAFSRRTIEKLKAKKRHTIWKKWVLKNAFEPLYGFDFGHKLIFTNTYFGGAK